MIPVKVAGFENQKIEVKPSGFASTAKLFVNGLEAVKGKKRGQMLLRQDDGTEVIAKWKGNFLDVPKLEVNGQIYHIDKPIKWYQWIWGGWPIMMIFFGGALGGICGAIALSVNLKIYRAEDIHPVLQYFITAVISVTSIFIYAILALLFSQAIN